MTEDKNENLILEIAQNTKKELEILENPENRNKITEAIKTAFISDRLGTSIKQEKLREVTLNALMDKISNEKVPLMTLLKILELTNKGGEVDLSNVIGNKGTGSNGTNVQINNNLNNPNEQPITLNNGGTSNKELGLILEGIKAISANIPIDKTLELRDIIKDDEL